MLALRFEDKRLGVAEVPVPAREGEALVRVRLAGVCNTDLEIARGYAGFEGTLAGDARHCPERTVLGIVGRDGAFAEYLQLPVRNLLPVPDEVPDERAVFTEPLAAACGITERVRVEMETRVAVIGDGKLGLLCAQALKATTGAGVTLVGRHESKLGIARERGVKVRKADELPPSFERAFDVAVEASGSPAGFETALRLLRPRGTLVLKSTFHGKTELNAAPVVVDEISIVGSRCGRFPAALELLRRDAVEVAALVHEEFPLSEGVSAMERAAEPGVLKVLLRM